MRKLTLLLVTAVASLFHLEGVLGRWDEKADLVKAVLLPCNRNPGGWDPALSTKRPNGSARSLYALDMDSSLIAMPAGKHGVRLRRYEVTRLDFA
jgi:hypothetical protein